MTSKTSLKSSLARLKPEHAPSASAQHLMEIGSNDVLSAGAFAYSSGTVGCIWRRL
jgi:hypothetical protein